MTSDRTRVATVEIERGTGSQGLIVKFSGIL